jgi:hypothetical protein
MNEDELLEFNYRSARKRNDLVELHRIFAVYKTTAPFFLIKPYIKNGVVAGTVITIENASYYAQENYEYVRSFL